MGKRTRAEDPINETIGAGKPGQRAAADAPNGAGEFEDMWEDDMESEDEEVVDAGKSDEDEDKDEDEDEVEEIDGDDEEDKDEGMLICGT